MSRFDDEYTRITNDLKIRKPHKKQYVHLRFKDCKISLYENDMICEMNTFTYPIPKDLLSELVDLCYKNDWKFVEEFGFYRIIKLILSSENLSKCKMNLANVEKNKLKKLMLICLPYEISIWKERLAKYFDDNKIENLFKSFNNENGVFGTYNDGFIICVNSNFIKTLKEAEEIIEHELIHMFMCIDNNASNISTKLEEILGSPNDYETYVVNLTNCLYNLYDKYLTKILFSVDTKEARKRFLDNVFHDAEAFAVPEDLLLKYGWHNYLSPELTFSNMRFIWDICHVKPDELNDIKNKIYTEFLGE